MMICTDSGKVLRSGLKIILIAVVCLIALWRMKKGFRNGMVKEIVNILSIIVACVSITLIFFSISSVVAHTFSTLTVCVIGLIGIGIGTKLCSLIFKPVQGIINISIVHGLDKMLGACMGLAEAAIFFYFAYRIMDYFGIATTFIGMDNWSGLLSRFAF